MAALIDTSIFVHAERSTTPAATLLRSVGVAVDEPVALAAITVTELLLGVELADAAPATERACQAADGG